MKTLHEESLHVPRKASKLEIQCFCFNYQKDQNVASLGIALQAYLDFFRTAVRFILQTVFINNSAHTFIVQAR